MSKKKRKKAKWRNWIAVSAWFRRSGPLKNKKKSIKKQRRWKQTKENLEE